VGNILNCLSVDLQGYLWMNDWQGNKELIKDMVMSGYSQQNIAEYYGVTQQRIHKVFKYLGIRPLNKNLSDYRATLKNRPYRYTWLFDTLQKNCDRAQVLDIMESVEPPTKCPVLGVKLDYHAKGQADNKPALVMKEDGEYAIVSYPVKKIADSADYHTLLKVIVFLTLDKEK